MGAAKAMGLNVCGVDRDRGRVLPAAPSPAPSTMLLPRLPLSWRRLMPKATRTLVTPVMPAAFKANSMVRSKVNSNAKSTFALHGFSPKNPEWPMTSFNRLNLKRSRLNCFNTNRY